jgi:flagellar hook protein FlgE
MPFSTSISGINAASSLLNVTSNNIANAETYGFKGARPEFVDVYARSQITGDQRMVGSGTRLSRVSQNFNQGTLETTTNVTDLAINGQGFFTIRDSGGNLLYTRAGAFTPDDEGYVVNAQGQNLQVYPPAGDGQFDTGQMVDLQISTQDQAPSATQNAALGVNLAADAERPAARRFDPENPNSYNYTTSMTVYDSQGIGHNATVYFEKAGRNRWQAHVYVDDDRSRPYTTTLRFDQDGNLRAPGGALGQGQFGQSTTQAGGALGQGQSNQAPRQSLVDVSYRPGGGGAGREQFTLDLSRVTQYDSNYGTNYVFQDGYTSGVYQGLEVSREGVVNAVYSNGERAPLGQVVLADFVNPQGLTPIGDTNWSQSINSGEPLYGQAGNGRFGQVASYSLESANVDLAYELTRLIIAQRDYSANTQALAAENNNIQTLLNIR